MGVCALVAASDFNADDFRKREAEGAFDCVIAVDAGFAHLEAIEHVPDRVLGDFDSLGFVPEGNNVEVHPAHKDKSDLELALDHACRQGFDELVIYGGLGGRLDHTIGALQMCARFAESGKDILFVDLDCAVRILVGPGAYQIPAIDGTVSVFSAVDESRGVTERGMEYPLENATLANRTTLGLSNELVGQQASVSVDQGTLFIFHPLGV